MTANPIQWLPGTGWIILSGGGDWTRGETDQVDANVLSLANLDRPMVVLLSDGDPAQAEALLEHYTMLGGPGGEAFALPHISRQTMQEPAFLTLLQEAGILYLGGEDPLTLARALQRTPALEQIVRGYATLQGLILVGAGGGAMALGAWISQWNMRGEAPGLGFVRNAIIAPHFTQTEEADVLRSLLREHPSFLGLGIPDGTALALGPQGEVQTWGNQTITAIVHA